MVVLRTISIDCLMFCLIVLTFKRLLISKLFEPRSISRLSSMPSVNIQLVLIIELLLVTSVDGKSEP